MKGEKGRWREGEREEKRKEGEGEYVHRNETEEQLEELPRPRDGWRTVKQYEAVLLGVSVTLNIKDSMWKA